MSKKTEVRRIPESLIDAISITLEQHIPPSYRKISIEQLKDEFGFKTCSTIYRWCEDENSHAPITLAHTRTLMDKTGNLSILDYLERRYNRIAIDLPKGTLTKLDEGELIDQYRDLTMEALNQMKTFFKQPTNENKTKLNNLLEKVIKKSASIQRYNDKKCAGQFEMELN